MSIAEKVSDTFKIQIAPPMVVYEFSEKSRKDVHFLHRDISSFCMGQIRRQEGAREAMNPVELSIDPYTGLITMTHLRSSECMAYRECNRIEIILSCLSKVTERDLTYVESIRLFPKLLYTFVAHHLVGIEIDGVCLYIWPILDVCIHSVRK